jgi:hypothetical protein
MAKLKEQEKIDMAKLQALEQENRILRQKVEAAEAAKPLTGAIADGLSSEMKKIRQRGKIGASTIVIRETCDYTPVSLWNKEGKQLGPMHPDNAVQTLNRFADIGVVLTVDKPTPEQIAAYKETPEYKVLLAKETKRRATKEKSRRTGQMEKITDLMVKLYGVTPEQLNSIKRPEEVSVK